MMYIFYVYFWLRYDGTPYYVGKGKGDRAFVNDGHRVHCPADRSKVIVQEHLCEADAFAAEVFLIAYYGRIDLGTGCLRNLTDGGDGASGTVVSKETRKKMSLAGTGRSHSEESKAKMRAVPKHKGFKHSEESKAKIGAASKGRTITEEAKLKISASKLGRSRPDILGRPRSEETKSKMREAIRRRENGDTFQV